MKPVYSVILLALLLSACKKEKEDIIPDTPQPTQQQPKPTLLLQANDNQYIFSNLVFNINTDVVNEFDFGDGTVVNSMYPINSHVYTKPGIYVVTMKAVDTFAVDTVNITYGTKRIENTKSWQVDYQETITSPISITKDPTASLHLKLTVSNDSTIIVHKNGKYFPEDLTLHLISFEHDRLRFKSGIKENNMTMNIFFKYDKAKNILKADLNFYNTRYTANMVYDVNGSAELDLWK